MKTVYFVIAVLVAGAVFFLIGFLENPVLAIAAHSEAEPWTFKAGRGLTLSEAVAKAVGLATAEVQSAELTSESGGITVPRTSVIDSVRGPFVYVENSGSFLRSPVQLGSARGMMVEVVDGLFEGDVVVTGGASGLWLIELQAVNGGRGCGDAH